MLGEQNESWEGHHMQRRKFLRNAGVGGAAVAASTALAAPAIAQSMPELKWRLASSFPKSLDTLYGAGEVFAKYIQEMTDNRFQIRVFASGEIVPGLQVLDAVQNGTIEMGHSAGTYYFGKEPALAIDTALPFGTNARQQEAWMRWGGGRELINEVYKDYNIHSMPCGNTGAQMGGWFRKEIKTLDDMKGLKFRIAGIAGLICAKLGAVPQQIAGGEIYPALEKGTIDAAEWVGPYDDQKLGFNKIAPFYMYPGWWEGGPQTSAYVNLAKWNELPNSYKRIIEAAAANANTWMVSKYDAENPKALRELVAGGTKLLPWPTPIMEAAFAVSNEIYADLSAKSPKFKKVYDNWRPFRNEEILWFRVAEGSFDTFMARMSAANKL
jgi:TRAP-type mannitol/chloroaromatic compound transport system substrate-binding protein